MPDDHDRTDGGRRSERALRGDGPQNDPAWDRLGYAPIAWTIAASIRAQLGRQDGFVYGVHGEWGSGKTTVLRFVLHELRPDIADEEIKVVHFNPWWFSGQEDLTRAFFDELRAEIGEAIGDEAKGALKKFAAGVSGASGLVKYGLGLVPGAAFLPEDLRGKMVDALGSLADEAPPSLNAQRQIVERALEGATFRTLVIIDDIDRLSGDEQLQVFRLVKSVADLPKVDYLLAFDDGLAERSLRARPEYAADPSYLEKIVQGSFHLPVLGRFTLTDWFVELINEIITDDDQGSVGDHWQTVLRDVIIPLLKTPRAVVRLADAVRTRWPSLWGEADATDLIGLEAIRLFDRDLYALIRDRGAWLTGEETTFGEEDKRRAKALLDGFVEEARRDFVGRALAALFPRFASWTDDHFFAGRDSDASMRGLGIANPARFSSYFGADLGSEAVPRREVIDIFEPTFDEAKVAQLFERYAAKGRRARGTMAPVLIDEIEQVWPARNVKEQALLLEAILHSGESLLQREDFYASAMSLGPDDRLIMLMRRLIYAIPEADRLPLLTEAVRRCSAPTLVTYLVHTLQGEHGLYGAKWQNDLGDNAVPKADVEQLSTVLDQALQSKLEASELDGLPDSVRLIGSWSRFASDGELKRYLGELLQTEAGRLRLARLLVSPRGWNSSRGSYDVVPTFSDGPIDTDEVAEAIREDIARTGAQSDPALVHFVDAFQNAKRARD